MVQNRCHFVSHSSKQVSLTYIKDKFFNSSFIFLATLCATVLSSIPLSLYMKRVSRLLQVSTWFAYKDGENNTQAFKCLGKRQVALLSSIFINKNNHVSKSSFHVHTFVKLLKKVARSCTFFLFAAN